MKRLQYTLLTLFFIMGSAGSAAETLKPGAYLYEVSWNGLQVASLVVGIEPGKGDLTRIQAAIRTYGIAQAASRYSSDSEAIAAISEATVKPVSFHTGFSMRKTVREIFLSWDDAVNIKRHEVDPPERPGKRTPVSKSQKSNAFDPLSAYFAARQKVLSGERKFTIPMFDGRRRSELQFEVEEKRKDGSQHITMREIFIAGYTGREQSDRAERDITIHIYLDPETLIPVGGVGVSIIGQANGKLAARCETYEECLEKAD